MDRATPQALELARRLQAREAEAAAATPVDALVSAVEKLRVYLTRFVGATGFRAILARALALARAEIRWLDAVQVQPDGSLDGFDEAARRQRLDEAAKGGVNLLAHLLGLLVIFVGEAVTLRMVQDVWPEASLGGQNTSAEETP